MFLPPCFTSLVVTSPCHAERLLHTEALHEDHHEEETHVVRCLVGPEGQAQETHISQAQEGEASETCARAIAARLPRPSGKAGLHYHPHNILQADGPCTPPIFQDEAPAAHTPSYRSSLMTYCHMGIRSMLPGETPTNPADA